MGIALHRSELGDARAALTIPVTILTVQGKMFHYSIPARSRSAGSSRFQITYAAGMLAAFKENVPPVGLHAVTIDVQNLNLVLGAMPSNTRNVPTL